MSASNIDTPSSSDNTDLTKLSNEELLAVVANLRQENKTLLKARNKVGLTFKRIPEDGNDAIAKLEAGHFPYLTKIDDLSVVKEEKTDGNIALVEGENLAVLAALQMTHKGKVDVIYIDPPYNTGNDDFIYEDKRVYKSDAEDLENLELTLDGKARTVGKDDPYRHSKWLSFMERRLFLAKELLSETGVIFVSIDDNEHTRLKLLMDNVFNADNFVANLIWKKKQGGGNDSSNFVTEHEYILVYAKTSAFNSLLDSKHQMDASMYPFEDELGKYSLIRLDKSSLRYSESLNFEIEDSAGNKYTPRVVGGVQSCWRWGKKKVEEDKDKLVFRNGGVYTKAYMPVLGIKPKSLLIDTRFGRSETGNDRVKAILGKNQFSFPKPVELIQHLLRVSAKKDALILDCFAGSGTTGHAVAELNKEDGGNRSAILVTNNEAGIAHNVTQQRIARALTGKGWVDGKEHAPLPGNLSYYRLDFTKLSFNPLTAAQSMEGKFDSLLSLENNALHLVEENADGDYAIYRNSDTVVFIWKNLFSLYDGEFEELLESLKSTEQAKSYIAYVPSDSLEEDISVEGWAIESFPHGYVERYKGMIDTMRRNQTLPNAK